MTQVQALGELWQEKNISMESPFKIGRRVKGFQEVRRIIIFALLLIPILIIVRATFTTGYTIQGSNYLLVLLICLGIVIVALTTTYTADQKHLIAVWDEFRESHDTLVRELDIQGASTALSDIVGRAKKRLQKQGEEIRKQFSLHEASVPTIDQVNQLASMTEDYWKFWDVCNHLGLVSDDGEVVFRSVGHIHPDDAEALVVE